MAIGLDDAVRAPPLSSGGEVHSQRHLSEGEAALELGLLPGCKDENNIWLAIG